MGFINELRERANSLFFRQMKLERERNKAMEAEKLEAEIVEREKAIEELESDFTKLSPYPDSSDLFSALSDLALLRNREFEAQQQKHFQKMQIEKMCQELRAEFKEQMQDFDEQIEVMNARIDTLSATVNTLLEQSQQERQEFRKRQEKRQTAKIIKEVTHNFHQN